MSIFGNNVTPSAPASRDWNKVGLDEWIYLLNEEHKDRWHPDNMWFSTQEDADRYREQWQASRWNKSSIKRKLGNMKHLDKEFQKTLDKVQDSVYQKYGVWLKYRIQYGNNKRIKSIYFIRFC